MRTLEIIRQKRRFEMFDAKSKDKVLELNSFFGKYTMRFDEKVKKRFIYYDTPELALQKSNIVLFKMQIGGEAELHMATEKPSATARYAIRSNTKHFSCPCRMNEDITKHKDFLVESFTAMFFSSLNFDPEFLLKKLKPAYTIDTVSQEYRSLGGTALKITYSFDFDVYKNVTANKIAKNNVLTIYQHSGPDSDDEFADLMGKINRYLGELTPTDQTKIMLARQMTQPKIAPPQSIKDSIMEDNKKKKELNYFLIDIIFVLYLLKILI